MKTFKQHVLTEAFTRQHYEAVARILKARRVNASGESELILNTIANDLADLFKDDNPRFDKGFFLNKCGV